ncbi:TPA: gp436 family protein [Salmonella enterica subsp. diarizonae serovar 61:l,v:z35]
MDYLTLTDLLDQPGVVELAQVTTPAGGPAVDPSLLSALIRGEDISDAPDTVQAGVKAARACVESVITEAQGLTDGYLRQRGYVLPLTTVPPVLTGWVRAIVRYKLHAYRLSDEKTDPIVRDYRDALMFLSQVALGKFSLGLGDTLPPAGGKPAVTGPGRTFSMDSLRDYGK